MRQHQRRQRGGRTNNNGHSSSHASSQNRRSSRHHVFDSNGPDGKIRGTAQQVHEKYIALARDAASAGDRITAESHYQHAEHYFRLWNLAMEEEERWTGQPRQRMITEDDAEFDHAETSQPAFEEVTQPRADITRGDVGTESIAEDDADAEMAARRPMRRDMRNRGDNRRHTEMRGGRREQWRERTPRDVQDQQPVADAANYTSPMDVIGTEAPTDGQGSLYEERLNLDRVVSARRESRPARAPAVRRERRPAATTAPASASQSPVAQLMSEIESRREPVDA